MPVQGLILKILKNMLKRIFYKDSNIPFLWHYMPELDSVTGNPIFVDAQTQSMGHEIESMGLGGEKLVLEIGSGKGRFLCEYAQMFPEACILGAEWDNYCASFTAKKLAKLGIKNAAVMRGDLFYFLRDLVPSRCIDEVHMYFPDPWPKRRQQKNRLILREGFLQELRRTLKPGKRLFYWATDHKEYNALALQAFKDFPYAKITAENTAAPTHGIETGFEKKYKAEGREVYRSVIELMGSN